MDNASPCFGASSPSAGRVAVIGVGCRFPGGADGPGPYWDLIRTGGDGVGPVPPDRWDVSTYYDPEPGQPNRLYVRAGGFLNDVTHFDAGLFEISDAEADSMDPQQRLVLETGWTALEDAGIAPATLRGSRTGVFVGIGLDDYARLMQAAGVGIGRTDPYMGTGTGFCFAAGRLSYVLGLRGPSISLDTACSSSLVAAHLACQSLRAGECDLAMAGGVNLILSPDLTMYLCGLRALAADGRCKTFDAAADGYGRGEGAGFVVLKRLDDALAHGDRILAVICGSAMNHDGASSGLTVPNGDAQQAVIRAALAQGGVVPTEVAYVETHGTGTALGDPIEVAALGKVYGPGRTADNPLHLGSVKSNIGHLEPAAGIAGLIKLVLALHHRTMPPQRLAGLINPAIGLDAIPACILTGATSWPAPSLGTRTGAVSAFGLSGTNAHMVLQEAMPTPETARRERPVHVLALGGGTSAALDADAVSLGQRLAGAEPQYAADLIAAASTARNGLRYRKSFVGSPAEIAVALSAPASPPRRIGAAPQIAFLFSGQGSQFPSMGRGLYETQPVFRAVVDRCAAQCARFGVPLIEILYPADASDRRIDQTAFTQPALFTISAALAALWRSWGVRPAAVMGHSVGEFAAAHATDALALEDALGLVLERGRLMGGLPGGGAMTAVAAPLAAVRPFVAAMPDRLAVAALNANDEVVLSGAADAVRMAVETLQARGIRCHPLTVSHAFHSPLMDPALDAFAAAAARCRISEPTCAMISNVTGGFADAGLLAEPDYWRHHLRQPVRFAEGLAELIAAGCTHFIEMGPGSRLLSLGRRIAGDDPSAGDLAWLPSLRNIPDAWRTLLDSAGRLYEDGDAIDWGAVNRGCTDRAFRAPAYPFQRKYHWFKPGRPAAIPFGPASGGKALIGQRIRSPQRATEFQTVLDLTAHPILGDHKVYGRAVVSGPTLISLIVEAARAFLGDRPIEAATVAFLEPLILLDDRPRGVSLTFTPDEAGQWRAEVQSTPQDTNDDRWTLHAQAIVSAAQDSAAVAPTPDAVRSRCTELITGQTLYDEVQTRVSFAFGKSYLWIDRLWRRNGEAIGRMRPADASDRRDGDFVLHPGLHDSCYQVFGAASRSVLESDLLLAVIPVGVDRFRCFGPATGELYCHATLWHGEDIRADMFAGDFTLYDAATGRVIAEAEGLRLRRAQREVMMRSVLAGDAPPLYRLSWRPRRETGAAIVAAAGSWLVTGGHDAPLLAAALREQTTGPVRAVDDAGLPAALADGAAGVVLLIPRESGPRAMRAAIEPVLQTLRVIANTDHTNIGQNRPARLWLVTQNGTSDAAHSDLSHAAVWGIGAVAALEHPGCWGGLIDLDAPSRRDWGACARHLLSSGNGMPEDRVRVQNGTVMAAVLEALPASKAAAEPVIHPDRSYLITGGLGELGLATAEWLASRGARNIVLIGRRPEAAGVPTAFAARGVGVRVAAVDVTDRDAMAALLAEMDGEHQPLLAGVFHAAGVLADRTLAGLDWAATEPVLAPKVTGALVLHELTLGQPLDLFVCYSSGASLIGSPGQGNYAAANAAIDALCRRRAATQLPATSINWGPWAGEGMAAVRDSGAWTARGVRPLSRAEGMELIGQAIALGLPQAAALAMDWGRYLAGAGASTSCLFDAVRPRGAAPVETGQAFPAWHDALRAAEPDRRIERLVDLLRPILASATGFPPEPPVPAQQGFFAQGMDSLMAIEFRNQLQARLGKPLPATIILDTATLWALARFLLDHVFELSARAIAPASPAPERSIDAALGALSDDEVMALLAKELEKSP
jgi:myxalamid-type polyketide synthase MxaC